MTQFYVPHLPPGTKSFVISSDEYHHIVKSFRAKESDIIRVFNGKGWVFEIKIVKIYKDKLEAEVVSENFVEKPSFEIVLCQSLIKIDKFELILEKVTEIGIGKIVPIITSRINVSVEKFFKKYERFRNILIESTKQSHRVYIPEIEPVKKIKEVFEKNNANILNIVCWKNAEKKISDFSQQIEKSNEIKIFIGPEGDFSEDEISFLSQQKDTVFVTLGKTILRSETAAIVSSALVFEYKQ
ncbi:MAG: 16S rRNA (uracil(1498)-N(3))-methyltransferase [Endomicrobia bacterium]|nr:16S rRNA (uracil(1498)-N(3))-methyltransferase [Endomicrobiia bacterium]MDW8055210.1 RsmE family RNA methyltransferase [Elusimicrobiota bacterium]